MIGTENGEEDDLTRRLATTVATSAGVCGRHLPLASRLERRVGIVGTRRRTSIIGAKRAWCLTGVTVGTVRITDVVDRKANGEPGCRPFEIDARVRAIKSLYPVARKRSIEIQRAGNPQVAQQKVLTGNQALAAP